MRFTVPGDPVGKARPRVVRRGGRSMTYTPDGTSAYEALVRQEYALQCGSYDFGALPVDVRISAYYGIPKSDSKAKRMAKLDGTIRPTKKPDCDNVAKAITDALNGIAYRDDSQVVGLVIEKYYSDYPRVEVVIEEAE